MELDINRKFGRVALPIKRRTVSRETNMLGEVHHLARVGVDSLSAEAEENAVLINRPTYAVRVDQYLVDLSVLTPKQRKDARKTLLNVEITEDCIRTGVLMMAVIEEGEVGVGPYEREAGALPIHRTEAGYPRCATCDGGGCADCTDPA